MTDTTDLAATPAGDESPRRSGGLSTMRLAELQGLASSLGLSGSSFLRARATAEHVANGVAHSRSDGHTASRGRHLAKESGRLLCSSSSAWL